MSSALAIVGKPQQAVAAGFNQEQIDLIRKTIAPDANDHELALFLSQCQRTGLDPFSRQIYFIKRGGKGSTQVSIDGFRVIAERSGEMDGQEVSWCGEDGEWVDVWLKKEAPAAARVLVYRKGCSKPFPAIAKMSEYNAGGPMWTKMPANQLAKCAESLALRKAFPHQLSGLYTPDEMGQAEHAPPQLVIAPTPSEPPAVGSCFITAVKVLTWGGEVTVVDSKGEVSTYPTTERRCATLAEQIAQERPQVAVTLGLAEITRGKNAGKVKLVEIHRVVPVAGELAEQNRTLDAEIASLDHSA
jgi:phage recombination protein Bet